MTRDAAFTHVLARLEEPEPAAQIVNPLAAAPPLVVTREAGADDWRRAADWTEAPPAEPAPIDETEWVRVELGPLDAMSAAALRRARRRFVWRNHPDRQAPEIAARCNRRVAIANMLIDEALRRAR